MTIPSIFQLITLQIVDAYLFQHKSRKSIPQYSGINPDVNSVRKLSKIICLKTELVNFAI